MPSGGSERDAGSRRAIPPIRVQQEEAAVPTLSFEAMLDRFGSIVWRTEGSSMWPLLKTGRDVVEIRPLGVVHADGRLRKHDVAFYKTGDRYLLHRVLEVRGDGYIICGDGNLRKETVAQSQVIGVMTAMTRKGKPVDLDGRRYRAYVLLWGARPALRKPFLRAARSLRNVAKRRGRADLDE